MAGRREQLHVTETRILKHPLREEFLTRGDISLDVCHEIRPVEVATFRRIHAMFPRMARRWRSMRKGKNTLPEVQRGDLWQRFLQLRFLTEKTGDVDHVHQHRRVVNQQQALAEFLVR